MLIAVSIIGGSLSGCGNTSKESNDGKARIVKSVILAGDSSAAILDDGSLHTWGENENGWLGNGKKDGSCLKPEKILDNVVSFSFGNDSGQRFGAALTEDGCLYAWGANGRGQLGQGNDDTDSFTPVKVMENVRDFSVGDCCIGAITEDGSLYTWGENYNYFLETGGQIGNGTTDDALKPVKIMDNVKTIDFGSYYAGAITEDGSLYMWGSNDYRQIGNGGYTDVLTPEKVMGDIAEINLSDNQVLALSSNGDLYSWGSNSSGALGIGLSGSEQDRCSVPTRILSNVKSIDHCAAITNDGELYLWSYDSVVKSSSPVKFMDNVSIVRHSVSKKSFAITNDGILYLWDKDSLEPSKAMDNAASVSYGSNHFAVIDTDGFLYICGLNGYGQLGDGTSKERKSLIKVKF